MKKFLAMLLCLTLLTGLCPAAQAEGVYKIGDKVEDFTLTTHDGQIVSLYGLLEEHDAVVLNFWFAACQPCALEFPYMEEAYKRYSDNLAILAITPADDSAAIAAYREKMGLTFLMANDARGVSERFVTEGYPTTVVIDRNGVYCYYSCGAMLSAELFSRLFEPFLAADYDAPLLNYEIPPIMPEIGMAPAEEFAAAVNAEGAAFAWTGGGAADWPWIIAEKDGRSCIMPGNAGYNDTYAIASTTVEAPAGAGIAFDFSISCAKNSEYLLLVVDGQIVRQYTGEAEWGQCVYPFTTSGEHSVIIGYYRQGGGSNGVDTAWVDNMQLLTAEEVTALTQAQEIAFTGLAANTRQIVFEGSDVIHQYDGGQITYFLVEEGDATLGVDVGERIPEAGVTLIKDGTEESMIVDLLPWNEQGTRIYTVSLNENAPAGTMIIAVYEKNGMNTAQGVMLFGSKEQIDLFVASAANAVGASGADVTWRYAQAGTAVRVTDAGDQPVAGVMINVCTDSTCEPMTTGEDGMILLAEGTYELHVLAAPEGYAFDKEQAWTVTPGETVTIVLSAAQ